MLALLFLIIALGKTQILQPVGKCLGTCRNCNSKQLTVCSGTRQNMCIPGYVPNFNTASCQLNSMYKNQISSLTDFLPNEDLSAWSDITNSICQYKTQSGQSKKISVLGTYNRQFALKRNYPLIKPFKIMLFNFNLIRDSWTPFNDFLLITIKVAGKIIKSFQISVEFRTPISPEANPIVCFGQNVLNEARTFVIQVPQANATDLQLQFNSQLISSATWGITNTRMVYGCGQYSLLNSVGDKCERCEAFQFFPEIVNRIMIGCKKCPIECLKCTDFNICQECQKGFELSSTFCVKKNTSNIVQLKQFISGNGKKCSDNFTFIKGTRQEKIEMIPDSPLNLHNRFSAIFTLVYNQPQWSGNTVLNLFLKTKHQKIKILDIKKINLTSKAINTCAHLAAYHSLLTFSSNKIPIYFDPKQPYQIDFQIENASGNSSTSQTTNVQFGINDIRIIYEQCGGTNCLLCGPEDQCTACIGMYPLNKSCGICPQGYGGKDCQQCSVFCSTCDSLKSSTCLSCKEGYNLIGQSCLPEQFTIFPVQKGFSPNSQQPVKTILCGSEISFLAPSNRKLSARLIFPKHSGLILGIKFYRVKEWSGKAEIYIDGVLIETKQILAQVGGVLCKGQTLSLGKDMSYIYIYRNQTHNKTESTFELTADGQLAISQFIVLLKNCDSCGGKKQNEKNNENLPKERQSTLPPFPIPDQTKLSQVDLIPQTLQESSSSSSTSTGIEVKINLNYPYKIQFNVTIDKISPKEQQISSYQIINTQHFLFIKINESFTNGTLQIRGWVPFQRQVKTLQGSIPRNLQDQQTTVLKNILLRRKIIERFDVITLKQTDPMQGLSMFLSIVSWIAVIGYIIAVPFSYGVIFEDLIINLQTVFLLIYINPEFLPFSLSKSLAGLERMENLDFLIENHYTGISTSWLGNVIQNTPLYLTQFKIDLNFTRALIPIILINVVFVVWFVVSALLNRKLENDIDSGKRETTKFTILVHSIGGRPLNYFDQIFRIQFMVTVWLSLIQFKNFSYPLGSDRSQTINIIVCISSLVISLVWLAFVVLFTKYQQQKMALTFFTEMYQDIFYTKSSLLNYPTIHIYLSNLFRYASFFCLALAAAYMNTQPVLWFALSIMLNIFYIIYSWKTKIYTYKFAFFLKIVDSIVLILISLFMIIIFGVGDQMHKDGYFVLGYLVVSMAILIVVNGFVRALYFGYKKITDLIYGTKDQSQFVKPVDTQRIV